MVLTGEIFAIAIILCIAYVASVRVTTKPIDVKPFAPAVTPPVLAKQFTCNYTIQDITFANTTDINLLFNGFFALDDLNGGGKFVLGGEEYIPLYIHTNFVAHPDKGNITGYFYEGKICWDVGQVPIDYLHIFPLDIPPSATFIGNSTNKNGDLLSQWEFVQSYSGYSALIDLFARYADNGIDKIIISDLPYLDSVTWQFYNIKTGPFDPHIYDPPALKCVSGPFANISPVKTMRGFYEMLAMLLKH